MKRILSLIMVIVFILAAVTTVYAKTNEGGYEYEVTTKDKKWLEIKTKDEMINACKISKDKLEKMTTKELLEAVLNYPMLYDIFLYSSYEEGVKALYNQSDAYRMFVNQDDASEVIDKKYTSITTNRMSEVSLHNLSINILAMVEMSSKSISRVETEELRSFYETVKTPFGSPVDVIIYGDSTAAHKKALYDYAISTYPQATYVSYPTSNYNCHSYAWHSSSTSNIYWIPDPTIYMEDTSYSRVFSAVQATRIHYSIGDHSAKVYDANSNSFSAATVISKWGEGPVMIHQANYGPYSSRGLTGWR